MFADFLVLAQQFQPEDQEIVKVDGVDRAFASW